MSLPRVGVDLGRRGAILLSSICRGIIDIQSIKYLV